MWTQTVGEVGGSLNRVDNANKAVGSSPPLLLIQVFSCLQHNIGALFLYLKHFRLLFKIREGKSVHQLGAVVCNSAKPGIIQYQNNTNTVTF